MMNENTLRKIQNILIVCPKDGATCWTNLDEDQRNSVAQVVRLFLKVVSGNQATEMLNDILTSSAKQDLPNFNDAAGKKRLARLTSLLDKTQPLKPWTERMQTSKMRLEIENVSRRCLSHLSGGEIAPMLEEILYPSEKESLAPAKYGIAVNRLGEAVRIMDPKPKAVVLNALQQSGFSKEDLRARGWRFSVNLWHSADLFSGPSHGNKRLIRRNPQFCVNRTKTETLTTSFCHLADSSADHAYEDDHSETKTVKLMLPNIDQL